ALRGKFFDNINGYIQQPSGVVAQIEDDALDCAFQPEILDGKSQLVAGASGEPFYANIGNAVSDEVGIRQILELNLLADQNELHRFRLAIALNFQSHFGTRLTARHRAHTVGPHADHRFAVDHKYAVSG